LINNILLPKYSTSLFPDLDTHINLFVWVHYFFHGYVISISLLHTSHPTYTFIHTIHPPTVVLIYLYPLLYSSLIYSRTHHLPFILLTPPLSYHLDSIYFLPLQPPTSPASHVLPIPHQTHSIM
jgi:hypothetical protein